MLLAILIVVATAPVRAAERSQSTSSPVRSLPITPSPGPGDGFTELTAASLGIVWTNRISPARYAVRQNLMNGAGVALADFDGDGWCDLFLCSKEGPSALFRNLGQWQFTNVTETAGLSCQHLIATGAVAADVNGDGRPDLHVTSFLGPDALFLNQGNGTFTNVTESAGVAMPGGATSAAFGDVDGDGDLDLYVCRFGVDAILRDGARIPMRMVGGVQQPTGRFAKKLTLIGQQMYELGEPDVLLLNNGQGVFTRAQWNDHFVDEDGRPLAEAPPDLSLAVQIRDLDGNGTPDIYVCSDFQSPDRIWLGDGRGKFRALPRMAIRCMSYACMGVDASDVDRDGHLDLFTLEMLSRDHSRHLAQAAPIGVGLRRSIRDIDRAQFGRNTFQWNRGDGTYAEIAWYAGLAMSDWSWCPIFLDVDLDGFEDLLVSNGHPHDLNDRDAGNLNSSEQSTGAAPQNIQAQVLARAPLNVPKVAWRNTGRLRFQDYSATWRFQATRCTHGMALADLDNDGDQDVVGNVWRDAPLIARNDSQRPRIAVRLRASKGNTHGIGAQVSLLGGPVPRQQKEILAGGRYLSGDQPEVTFAAGSANADQLSIEIRWPDGMVSTVPHVDPNRRYEIGAPTSTAAPPLRKSEPSPDPTKALVEVTVPALFTHQESEFDDFALQPLLPWRLSRLGPGIAVLKESQKCWMVLGAARGSALVALHLNAQGLVEPAPPLEAGPLPDDIVALRFAELSPGRMSLLAALANLESGDERQPSVLRFDRIGEGWIATNALPSIGASPGSLGVGDVDADGDLDVVVGGRCHRGRYPEAANSMVFTNQSGHLSIDAARSRALLRVGLVTDIAMADLNGDRRTDLILACEWGPIRILLNTGDSFQDVSEQFGMGEWTGLWQCLLATDLDGDQRIDIVAGNWGLNSAHQRHAAGTWRLGFADFRGTGALGMIEAAFDPAKRAFVPTRPRDVLDVEIPWLRQKYPTHRSYSQTTVEEMLRGHTDMIPHVEARHLASGVFYNRGNRFEFKPLPAQAQWTPIRSLCRIGPNHPWGDGLFCGQNFFDGRDEDDRMDAGRGLFLKSKEDGTLIAEPTATQSIPIYGSMRGCVSADFNLDGVDDLWVAQNNGPSRLFLAPPSSIPRDHQAR
ncbi:MAG: VCBS repeat-containing protein [Verrucomicrobiales bacterium]|nr:VCBS repeat-containing protein [Verrucomicrobiales bacterium]